MSYSEYWRREFLARHPEYERQSQVLQQETVQPSSAVHFALPISSFSTTKSESSELFSHQKSKSRDDITKDHSRSSAIIGQVCCLRQRLKLTQQELAKQLGISSRTLQDWEQGRRQPTGPGKALLQLWIDRQSVAP